ncbi:MAG: aminoacyl-tRNA hydrolase [Patescibacteria group bacterium]
MKLIVGLGNPGKEYEATRHNAGFLALDALAGKLEAKWKKDAKRQAETATTKIEGEKILLAKPQTYMNASGDAVLALANFYKIQIKDILVVQDDLDLEPGTFKLTAQGNHAGHKGAASIQEKLGTSKICRLRLGVGHPKDQTPVEDYVLRGIEKETSETITLASQITLDWIMIGTDQAMNKWNRK